MRQAPVGLERAGAGPARARWWGHGLFAVIWVAGATIRLGAVLAYQPVFLLQRDAYVYLATAVGEDVAPGSFRPVGYPLLFLRPLLVGDSLLAVAVAQHALALGLAVVLYLLMLRLGVPAPLAALGTAPLLLDGYQIAIEHYLLSETFFQTLVVAALALVMWWRRPPLAAVALSGALIGTAALTRFVGAAVIVPAVFSSAARKLGWARAAALVIAFAAPLLAYALWFRSSAGTFGVTDRNGFFLYGRVASFADCRGVALPPRLRRFCFEQPPEERAPNRGVLAMGNLERLSSIEGANSLLLEFSRRMILNQPLDYARVVGADLLRYFEARSPIEQEPYVRRWRFPRTIADADPRPFVVQRGGSAPPQLGFQPFRIRRDRAVQLRAYQSYVYTWGPLLGGLLLIGLAGALSGMGRGGLDPLAHAAGVFTASALLLVLGSVATTVYHFRYGIATLPLAGPAGALGAAALARRWRSPEGREDG